MTKNFGENSYQVSWLIIGQKYCLWVNNNPSLKVEMNSFAEAEEQLVDKIHDRYGRLGIQLIFDPPKPAPQIGTWRDSGWLILLPNEFFGSRLSLDLLFSEGVCRLCKLPSGKRSSTAISLSKNPGQMPLGYVAGKYPVPVVSSNLLDCLSVGNLAGLEMRKCGAISRNKTRDYFELLPGKLAGCVDLPFVADMVSWRCDLCGRIQVDQYLPGPFRYTVTESNLPTDSQVGLAGFPFDYDLIVTRDLWNQIRKSDLVKGIVAEPLGMIDKQEGGCNYRQMLSEHWKVDLEKLELGGVNKSTK